MPTYVYECKKCGHRFEVFHSMSDNKPRKCPECRGRAVRVPAAGAGLLFKGSGFYITDYRSSSYKKDAKSEGSSTVKGGAERGGSKPPESSKGDTGGGTGGTGGTGGKEKRGKRSSPKADS